MRCSGSYAKPSRLNKPFGINPAKPAHTEASTLERPMAANPQARNQPEPTDRCLQCGGSGVLRTDAAGYRTCLTCVGQGSVPDFEAVDLAGAIAGRSSRWQSAARRGFRGDLSAWISGAR